MLISATSIPKVKKRNRSFSFRQNQNGLSLIEIMVTLAIISLILGVTVGVVGGGDESKLRDASFRLRTVIRYVYSEAVRKKMYYRLVLNFEENSYKVEAKSEPFLILKEGEEDSSASKKKTEGEKSLLDEAMEKDSLSEEDSSKSTEEFAEVSENLARKVQLPSNIKFMDVLVAHLSEKANSGVVEIFFFPNGWVERSIINLSNEEEDNFYSLEVNSLTGKSTVRADYLDMGLEDLEKSDE